ncbi:MAG: hypothetical protein K2M76_00035, partial [Muribaculaceae bacterium]|nr:hypothetical protein [Muribaculaceae bacterium]
MNNRPGTMDQFAHVNMDGKVSGSSLTAFAAQHDIKGRTGYSLGLEASLIDSVINISIKPYNPVIAYKTWTVNDDNFISYRIPDRHLSARLDMAGDNSRVQLFTKNTTDSISTYDDVVLKVDNFKLSDWLAINPFAPPVQGSVNADLIVSYRNNKLNSNGSISLDELYYGGKRVGSFDLGVDISTDMRGAVNAEVALMVDSIKTITAVGCLNDTTKANPFDLDFTMIRMPLRVANPFLPAGTASLSGMLNGTMQITGDIANPIFNGYIDFDSAAVNVDMLGTSFSFSTDKVPVDSNVVRFSDYAIKGVNSNPLLINGSVDMSSLSEPRIDLSFNARNMQIVGGKKSRKADVYGKAFIDLDAYVKGNMQFLKVDADLSIGLNVHLTRPYTVG